MNKKYLTILIHVSGWTAFFVFPFVLLNFPADPNSVALRSMRPAEDRPAMLPFFLINNILFILFFYFNLFYLLPGFYYKQRRAIYFTASFLLLLTAVYTPSFIKTKMLPAMGNFDKREIPGRAFNISDSAFQSLNALDSTLLQGDQFKFANSGRPPFRRSGNMDRILGFLQFLIIWFLSSIVYLSQRYRRMEQRNKEMNEQKLHSELSYLKAQINPHFLFNTLNNIYSLSICESKQTPDAILKLSSIMRYVIQDAEAEKVLLEKELDYLTDYIALQQLRSNKNLHVSFTVIGDVHNQVIAPLLLINFIENAFKHGVSNHVACFVNITITNRENQLTLEVKNKITDADKAESTATGSNNTKRRLLLQYPDKHVLTTEEKDGIYKITLQLNLA